MKIKIIGCISIAMANVSIAQNAFNAIYNSAGSYQLRLIELSSGNLLSAMAKAPGISLLDPDGAIILSSCYWSDSIVTMQSIKKYGDNEFYFVTGYRKDSCSAIGSNIISYSHPVIGRMDSLGNVMEFNYYVLNASDACGNVPADLEVLSDGSIITWGREDNFFALKVDSILTPVWGRRFMDNGGFRIIKELPGGDLLAGFDMEGAGASVARMDANGNFLWCKSYIRPSGQLHDAVVEADGSIIVTGYTATTPPKLFMMKLDGEGDVQWCRGYDSGAAGWSMDYSSRFRSTMDGNYVFLATLGSTQFPYFDKPFLMKTDTNGDTLWTRSMGAEDNIYITRDLLASADGGFLFSGTIWGDLPGGHMALPYIFKTDSLGHFSCQERYHPVEVLDLFPTDSSFTLTSIDGATVHPAFVSDTTFAPIAVYDACLVTRVPENHTAKQRSVRVYPNPTPGRFSLAFSDPLLRDSYYSVYDPSGRLLLQRPLPTGATLEEVDLSRFGRGTYVLRVTDPEGLRHERVVVE